MNKSELRVFGLDVIRAIAIILVFISHGRIFLVKDFPQLDACKIGGFYGVELFFVLSGFLIGGILIKLGDKLSTFDGLISFWKRRWYRTLPNYYLFLVINAVLAALLSKSFRDIWLYIPFMQNLIWEHPPFFGEAWSLAVEEWFYLLLPFSIFLLRKTKVKGENIFLLLSLVFLITPMCLRLFYVIGHDTTWDRGVRKIVLLRLDAIMFGMVAVWFKITFPSIWSRLAKPLIVLGTLIIISATVIFFKSSLDTSFFCKVWLFPLVSLGFACFLPYCDLWSVERENIITMIFRKLALWSYSIYLCNLAVLVCLQGIINQELLVFRVLSYVLFFVLTTITASLTYRFIEKPVMKLRDK